MATSMLLFAGQAGVLAALLVTDAGQSPPPCDVFSVRKGRNVDMSALQALAARGCVDADGRTPLHWLAQDDDAENVALVGLLVRRGANVNAVASGGETPLHVATRDISCAETPKCTCSESHDSPCWRGNPNMVRALLAHGADPNAADVHGTRPLYSAVSHNQLDEVVALLQAGARPTGHDGNQDTIWDLMRNPEPRIVAKLLAHGGDPNERNGDGEAALHALALHGEEVRGVQRRRLMAIARMLAARGADVRATSDHGRTPLHVAASTGFAALARLVIAAGAPVDVADKQGQTALHLASFEGHADVVALLLQRGAAAGRKDAAGLTPLHWLARGRHSHPLADGWGRTIRLLVRHGGRFDAQDNLGRTPLFHAVRDVALAGLLISSGGAAPNVGPQGASPLHVAAYRDGEQLVRALIAAGLEVDARDRDGRTPLHWAAFMGRSRALGALVAAPGIDLDAADKMGRTPLDWAVAACQKQVAELLRARGARPPSADGIRRLDACAAQKPSPLHGAARRTNIHEARALIAAGANVNARDQEGRTPLHASPPYALGVPFDLYQLLIDKGADVSARDAMGRSPLHAAYDIDEEGTPLRFAQTLVCRGADPNPRDLFGWTPIDIARLRGWRAPTIPACAPPAARQSPPASVPASTDGGLGPQR